MACPCGLAKGGSKRPFQPPLVLLLRPPPDLEHRLPEETQVFPITDMSGLTLIEIPMRSGAIQPEGLHLPFLKRFGGWTLELLMTGKHSLDMRMRQGPLHG